MINKTDFLIQFNYWIISCFLTEDTDWLWNDFDICMFVNKQAVCVVKNCDDDILEKTAIEHYSSTALAEKAIWIVTWKLKDLSIFNILATYLSRVEATSLLRVLVLLLSTISIIFLIKV